jgi:phosphatidylserine/phosphatidylglycerophosphate/cardiolipin synthase-like enzyme
MRRLALILALTMLGCNPANSQPPPPPPTISPPPQVTIPPMPRPTIEVYFSPKGGCTDAVVRELAAAKNTVLVQAYSFTSAPIVKALVDAHKRGVTIKVILDKSQRTEK